MSKANNFSKCAEIDKKVLFSMIFDTVRHSLHMNRIESVETLRDTREFAFLGDRPAAEHNITEP